MLCIFVLSLIVLFSFLFVLRCGVLSETIVEHQELKRVPKIPVLRVLRKTDQIYLTLWKEILMFHILSLKAHLRENKVVLSIKLDSVHKISLKSLC